MKIAKAKKAIWSKSKIIKASKMTKIENNKDNKDNNIDIKIFYYNKNIKIVVDIMILIEINGESKIAKTSK